MDPGREPTSRTARSLFRSTPFAPAAWWWTLITLAGSLGPVALAGSMSVKHDLGTWTVTDDWPDPVPVREAEIGVFQRWFGDLFDGLFDPDGGSPDAGVKIDLENGTEK